MVMSIILTLQIEISLHDLARTLILVNDVVVFHGMRGVQGLGGNGRIASGRVIMG
jgi:hypothetical protein